MSWHLFFLIYFSLFALLIDLAHVGDFVPLSAGSFVLPLYVPPLLIDTLVQSLVSSSVV